MLLRSVPSEAEQMKHNGGWQPLTNPLGAKIFAVRNPRGGASWRPGGGRRGSIAGVGAGGGRDGGDCWRRPAAAMEARGDDAEKRASRVTRQHRGHP
jgi:hypothetical protein